jgi:hypothetical protein
MTPDVRPQNMNDFTKDLGHKLLLLLWETSTYPDPDDVSTQSRAELVVRVVDSLCGSSYGCEADLQDIIKTFVSEFVHSPYRDRAKCFGADLMALMTAEHDPRNFLQMGCRARAAYPKRVVPKAEREKVIRECERARAKCLGALARTAKETSKKRPNNGLNRTGAPRGRGAPSG